MLLNIVTHTPPWVFVSFVVLLWLGMKQLLTHELSLLRVSALALGMSGWSLYSVATAFSGAVLPILVWLVATGVLMAVVLRRRPLPLAHYDPSHRRLTMPGSPVPLALMMGIFVAKFAVGVALSMQPTLSGNGAFAIAVGAVYGAFSGGFTARALRLWRLAFAQDRRGVSIA
ncbi:hypothetical protein Tther_01143 [Tepidimonas thermarum]|uniref:Transmembrane protein n=1 Tax=Tepidimonas thermarum TaxID=335431 RepID=A0A554X2Y6_9BURK|nr:DUF6622 family protein [Tepidimonas thermarum]TSE30153.1 hypothetical protein Tther_01143 [Tepidimonas thermarum]